MKMKNLSLCVALGFAFAALSSPAFAADKDKKATAAPAKTTSVGTSAAKAAVAASKPAATVETAKTAVDTAKAAAETPKKEVPLSAAKEAVKTPVETVPAPAATESSSFFGGFKKLFGSKEAPVQEKPQAAAPAPVPAPAPAPAPESAKTAAPAPESAKTAAPAPAPIPVIVPPSPVAQRAVTQAAGPSLEEDVSVREKAVDSKALDRAKSVAKLFDEKEKLKGSFSGMVMMMTPMLSMENPGKMDVIQKSIASATDKMTAEKEDLVVKNKAVFLAQTFTADELSQLEKFYESSVGQKLIKTSDEISRNDGMFIQRLVMSENQKTRDAVLKEIRKNDLKVPKGLE